MPKDIKISKTKQKWFRERPKQNISYGEPLHYNADIEIRLQKKLDKLVEYLTRETKKELVKSFNESKLITFDSDVSSSSRIVMNRLRKKFDTLFKKQGLQLTKSMIGNTEKAAASNVHNSLKKMTGLVIKTSDISARTKQVINASSTESANLIKTIQSQYLDKIAGEVSRSIISGQGLKDLVPYLDDLKQVTKRRARNIALDQTKKVYSSITLSKMQDAGVKKFEWIHSGGSAEPRKEHVAHNGKIYSFDNLPLYKGVPDYPARLPFCRCIARPVIEFDDE